MGKSSDIRSKGQALRRWAAAGVLTLSVGTMGACGGLLDVTLPGDVTEEDLLSPALSRTLVNGAVNDFECSFATYILSTSVWTGELMDASTWQPVGTWQLRRATDVDAGTATCPTQLFRGNGTFGPYLGLQIARNQAIRAFDIVSGHPETVANKQRLLATAAAYEGYATTLLGEGYCEMRLDPEGEILTPAATLAVAEQRFAKAMELAQAAGANDILNLARVGRARVLNDLGKKAEAKAFAEAVPAGFVHNATYTNSPDRRVNWVAAYNHTNLFVSVPPAYRNLTIDGVRDVRVPARNAPNVNSNDAVTPIWLQELYTGPGTPIPMASWQEAKLIIAEAEASAGNVDAAAAAINALRDHYKLPRYTGTTAAAALEQVKEERRRQLYLQSHRLGDMLRFNLPFATGRDSKGRTYSDGSCLLLPDAEL